VLPSPKEKQLNSLVKVLEAANNTSVTGEGSSNSPVAFGRGLASLSRKLVEQIKANQYVDFADFPPARGHVKPLSQLLAGEGQVVLLHPGDLTEPKKVIPNFAVWSQCFSLYVAALSPSQEKLTDLLAYQSFIARCSLKYKWPSWVVYDQNFRSEVANQPDRLWAISDSDLYGQAFTNQLIAMESWCTICQSLDHTSGSCPRRPLKRPLPPEVQHKKKICHNFNDNNGDCRYGRECLFRHACILCGGPHPKTSCRQGKKRKPREHDP